MRGNRRSRSLTAIERTLLVAGVVCVSWYGGRTFEIHRQQDEARRAVARIVVAPARATGVGPPPALMDERVMGRIDIPSIRLSAAIVDTDDDEALGFAVGYLPDTPPPWAPGNSVFAAHRDELFRPLQHVQAGDQISLTTRRGSLRYRVLRTLIVRPSDVWVLGAAPHVDLTLITCFPFHYVGSAPQRFIVQAEKVYAPPTAPAARKAR
jgi:sortase A